jgi:hypothetical protein
VLHAAAISVIEFPKEIRPGLIILPLLMIDGLLMYGVIRWFENRLR